MCSLPPLPPLGGENFCCYIVDLYFHPQEIFGGTLRPVVAIGTSHNFVVSAYSTSITLIGKVARTESKVIHPVSVFLAKSY